MCLEVVVIQPSGETGLVRVTEKVVQSAKSLPFAPERYFVIDTETVTLPISMLIQTRARLSGIEKAVALMALAYDGMHALREPISVIHGEGGKYRVLDGNSTVTVARAAGWHTIPCKVVS
jgi:hypothetical protein